MKKTVITLLALAGIAAAADTAVFDFKADNLTAQDLTAITLTDELTQYTATIETAGEYALTGGTWSGDTVTGANADYIAANSKATGATLSLTLGGLVAGGKYDVTIVTGVPFEGAGAWNSMNTTNSYESTSLAFGSQNVQVRNITTYDVTGIEADANGEITFSIGKHSDAHTASFNYASITAAVPEPTSATLSLLALAGLAARRRRR